MERFSGIEAFVAVVEEGSFTAAAASLGVSKGYISKQVSALEDRLGARLLNRTTRSHSLTSAGTSFHARCTDILQQMSEAEQAVAQLQTQPRGLLKASVPLVFGVRWLAPMMSDFLAEHEGLEVELDFSDRKVDLVDEGFDVVVRIGALQDSSFAFKRLAPVRSWLCVSPAYLAEHGPIRSPADLNPDDCLSYSYHRGSTWKLSNGSDERLVKVSGRYRANNGDALAQACASGLGISFVPDFIAAPMLRTGELVTVLDDWTDDGKMAIWALYPHSRHLSAKVRSFVDFVAGRLDPCPWDLRTTSIDK